MLCGSCSASSPDANPPIAKVGSIKEIGVVPRPPGHDGRDVGFSALFQGRSVWIFGDTFLPEAASDGLQWRSSSWSWTTDVSTVGPFVHAVDAAGLTTQLLPHTSAEATYNRTHEGHANCAASTDCGSRATPWPGAIVTDRSGQSAVIYYLNMRTGSGGAWDFASVSGSVATWHDSGSQAVRIEPPLFSNAEPDWGAAAVLVGDDIFVYACDHDGSTKSCLLARVPFDEAANRASYRYWSGDSSWSDDWTRAQPVFDGASLFSIHYNAYLDKYLAFYLSGMASEFALRTSDMPQGPWSDATVIGNAEPAAEDWSYALIAHPEFSRDNGRVEILSYTRPSGFLEQEIRLVELRFE